MLVYVGAAQKRSSGQHKRRKNPGSRGTRKHSNSKKTRRLRQKKMTFFSLSWEAIYILPPTRAQSFRRLFAALATTFRGGARDEETETTVLEESGSIPIQRQSVVPGGNGKRRVFFQRLGCFLTPLENHTSRRLCGPDDHFRGAPRQRDEERRTWWWCPSVA